MDQGTVGSKRPVDIDCISTMRTLFPQKKRVITTSFSGDYEYDSNQRKRDLPEGESRQGLSREPATGLARHTGNWMLTDGTEKALTTNVITEENEDRGLRPGVPGNSGVAIL
jgi:hypothetical protein